MCRRQWFKVIVIIRGQRQEDIENPILSHFSQEALKTSKILYKAILGAILSITAVPIVIRNEFSLPLSYYIPHLRYNSPPMFVINYVSQFLYMYFALRFLCAFDGMTIYWIKHIVARMHIMREILTQIDQTLESDQETIKRKLIRIGQIHNDTKFLMQNVRKLWFEFITFFQFLTTSIGICFILNCIAMVSVWFNPCCVWATVNISPSFTQDYYEKIAILCGITFHLFITCYFGNELVVEVSINGDKSVEREISKFCFFFFQTLNTEW